MSLGRANPNLFSFLTCGRSFFESLLEEGLPQHSKHISLFQWKMPEASNYFNIFSEVCAHLGENTHVLQL